MPLREVDTLRFQENWRDITPFGSETSSFQGQEIVGSGFSYKFSASSHARAFRNRFIVWRIIGSTLELIEHSLDYTLSENAVRIHFKYPLLNNICIFDNRDGAEPCICIFVATQGKTLHRFVFPHPSSASTTKESPSIFASLQQRPKLSKVNHLDNICRAGQPTVMCCLNERTLFLGCSNGTVTCLTMGHPSDSTQTHDEIELREGSIVSYLWSVVPKTPFSKTGDSKERAISSISSYSINASTYVFTFSVDSKLRVWSVSKQQCIYSADIQFQSWNQRTDALIVRQQSMQFVAPKITTDKFKLVFYLSTANEAQFQIFSGLFSLISGQESVSISQELVNTVDMGESIVDYLATPSHLWTICSQKEGTTVKYSGIEVGASSGLQTNSWNEVFMDSPEVPARAPAGDLERFFFSKIFEPGRFSNRIILKALHQFRGSSGHSAKSFNASESSLRRQILQEVQNQIQQEVSRASSVQDISQAAADAICESIWKRFMLSCVKKWKEEHQSLGLIGIQHNELVCVVKRSAISFIRSSEKLESFHLAFSTSPSLENASEKLFDVASDQSRILLCAYKITRALGNPAISSFDTDLFYLDNPIDLCYQHVSNLIGGTNEGYINEEARKVQRNFYSDFMRVFRHVTDPVQIIGDLLDSVNEPSVLLSDSSVHVDAADFAESLFGGQLSELLTASVFRQVVTSRYELIRGLALLICTIIRLRSPSGISSEKLNELSSSVSSKAMNLLKTYYVVGWLSNQIEEDLSSDQSTDSVESSIAQFSNLEISGTDGFKKGPASIIQLFFRRNLSNIQRKLIANSQQLTNMFRRNQDLDIWEIFNQFIIGMIQSGDSPLRAANLAAFLKDCGQFSMVQDYIRLLDSKIAPLSHLLGETYMHFGQFQKSRDCFFQAASALESSNSENKSGFRKLWSHLCSNREAVNIMSTLPDDAFIVHYYIFISQLFAEQAQHDIVCEFSFAALGSLDKIHDQSVLRNNVPHLWSTIFKHSVEMGNYDQAYQAVTSNPDEVRRLDSLRRLIVVLVENNKLKLLSSYPFVGLTDHVKRILYEKAVYNDITLKPNYYRVSYAYHVTKGNYRQAAASMYELAQRMSLESYARDHVTLSEQASCYSASIHALKMVDKKYQWIPKFIKVKEKEFVGAPASPKRKRLEMDENMDPEPPVVSLVEAKENKSNLTVVTLSDLEKLFGLVTAQARLLERNPKIQISGEFSDRDTIYLLTSEGFYDTAISLSILFEANLKTVLETLTAKCLQYQYSPSSVANDYVEHDWLSGTENFQPSEKEGTYWRLLEEIVKRHDSRDTNFEYHSIVADKILSLDHRMKLPHWLTFSLKEKNSSSLLKIYMKHQLFEDAGFLIVDLLRDVRTKIESKAQSVWVPYGLIDQLLQQIKPFTKGESPAHKKLLRLRTDIEEGVKLYLKDVENRSSQLKTNGMIQ